MGRSRFVIWPRVLYLYWFCVRTRGTSPNDHSLLPSFYSFSRVLPSYPDTTSTRVPKWSTHSPPHSLPSSSSPSLSRAPPTYWPPRSKTRFRFLQSRPPTALSHLTGYEKQVPNRRLYKFTSRDGCPPVRSLTSHDLCMENILEPPVSHTVEEKHLVSYFCTKINQYGVEGFLDLSRKEVVIGGGGL